MAFCKHTFVASASLCLMCALLATRVGLANGGIVSCAAGTAFYGTCQTACNAGWVTCLAGYGVVAGAVGPVGWYAWLTSGPAACSAAQGVCMAVCATSAAALCVAPAP